MCGSLPNWLLILDEYFSEDAAGRGVMLGDERRSGRGIGSQWPLVESAQACGRAVEGAQSQAAEEDESDRQRERGALDEPSREAAPRADWLDVHPFRGGV